MKYEKMNNLFLRQSYLDSWEDYERSLKKKALSNGIILY
jgi:fucokinase